MKKYFTRLLTLAVIAPALVSCAEQLPDFGPQAKKHTVYFSTAEEATRTGLSIDEDEGIVTPDWRGTTKNDVYVFEMDGTQTGIMGETTELFYEEDALEAHFKVDFYTNMTIHVETPPSPTLPADGTRASGSGTRASGSGYTYGAVVANKNESEEEPIFYIPATQKPDPNTLKDPGAEFLIGFSRDAYDAEPDGDANFVDLYFDRVAALSRIGFSEFQGTNEKVMSIKINSETSMTGWASFNDIRFGNTNKVTFHQDEGPGLLALNYGDGLSVTAGETFYAYFVSMPGTFKITSIEILTDQYSYTKEINKDVEFTITELKNLKLIGATAEKISSNVWYKASMLEAGYDYIIVSNNHVLVKNNDGEIPSARDVVVADNNTISIDASEDILWTASAVTSDYGQCTLTNGSVYLYRSGYQESNLKLICEETSSANYVPWRFDGSYLSNGKTTQYYAYYDGGWKMLLVSEGGTTKPSVTTLLFTNRAPQNISFSADNAKYDLYEGNWIVDVPTLSNAQTTVTYALSDDSDPDVATVNPTTGEVTVGSKIGTVTVIATATGNDAFQAASASYTLTVVNNDPNVKVYRKITSINDLEVGAEYLLVFEGRPEDESADNHNPKVFKPILETSSSSTFTKSTNNALDVVILASTISSNEYEDCHLTLETGYYLKVDKYSKYLYPSYTGSGNSARGTLNAESSASNALSISFNDGIVQIKTTSGSWYFVWSTSSNYFSASESVEGSYSTGICLYKLVDDREPQSLSFSPTSATYDLYAPTSFIKPTLSTAYGTVTYSSSNNAIAEVDNSGNITGHMKGTVTITATAAGNTEYKPGSASYELEVIDSTPVTMVTVNLKKATRVSAGKQYVLVSNGYALLRNGDTAGAVAFSSNSVTIPSTSQADLEWTLGTNTDSNNRGNIYDFSNGGYYFGIAMNTSGNSYTYSVEMSQSKQVATSISMPNHNVNLADGYIYYRGNSSSQYVYYDSATGKWNNHQLSNGTFDANYKTTLYVVDDGTVEPTTTYYLASSIEAGKEYVIVSNGKALLNESGSAGATDVTVSDGKITVIEDNAMLWKAEADGDNTFAFSNGTGNYLRRNSSNTGNIGIGDKSSSTYNNRWSYNSNNKRFMLPRSSTQTYYLYYNSGAWSIVENTEGETLLYTTDPGSNPGGGDDPTPTSTYTLINSLSELESGATYLIVSSDSGNYNNKDHKTLFAGDQDGTAANVSASNGTITGAYSAYEFVITKKSDSDYSLHGPNGYVTGNSGTSYSRYIQVSSSEVTMSLMMAADNSEALVSNAFYFYYTKTNSKEVLYLNSDGKYKIGGSGRKYGVYLYKKAGNP